MKTSPLFLLAALFMFGCSQDTAESEDAPTPNVLAADDPAEEVEEDLGDPQESKDPMVTVIRTQDGRSETSKVRISELHLSDFPAPHMNDLEATWDEAVTYEVNWDDDPVTQILSYRTKASSEEYVQFFSSALSGAKVESQGSVAIVRGKNEFGDEVEVQFTPPESEGGYAQIKITAQG